MFTDQQVMEELQYHTLEVPDLGNSWESQMWTKDEIVTYLNQRQNKFLKDSLVQIGIALIPVSVGTEVYDLPDDWINTVRILLIRGVMPVPLGTGTKALGRSDTWESDHGIPTWTYVNAEPKLYYDEFEPISIGLMPIPAANATVQIHYVPLAAELTGEGELLTVPNEFVPCVKYGALSDMFSKVGRANDVRAKYCEQRYLMGVEVARLLVGGFKE